MKRYIRSSTDSETFAVNNMSDIDEILDYLRNSLEYRYEGRKGWTPKVKLHISDQVLQSLFDNNGHSNFMSYLRELVTRSDYNKFKERLTTMINSHDSWYFKPSKELVQDIAQILSNNADKAPYDIRLKVKPTSVYVLIRIRIDDLLKIDPDEFYTSIQHYTTWIRSLPEVGDVEDEELYKYFDNIQAGDATYDRWPYLPIKVLPAYTN